MQLAAHLSLGISLNEENDDVRGDEPSSPGHQDAPGLVLGSGVALALGEGAGNAVHHLSYHCGRVHRRWCTSPRALAIAEGDSMRAEARQGGQVLKSCCQIGLEGREAVAI